MLGWPSTLRSRLTLWYTVLLGLPLVVFAVLSYLAFARTLGLRTDRFIGEALTAFSSEVTAERRTALNVDDAMLSTIDEVRFRDLHIAILDSAGRVVVRTPPPDSGFDARLIAALRRRDPARPAAVTIAGEHGAYRVITRPLVLDQRRFSLTGTYSLSDIEGMLGRIRRMFMVAIPLLVLTAAGGGYALARRSLAPVATMGAQAAKITASNLDQRLPVGGGDELAGLAQVVNDLLDRLEQAFAQQRRFVADASHELRTPAAIVRTEAEVTLAREHRPEDEYRSSLTVMQDAARRLTRVVDELFILARADAGHLVARNEALYLEDVVHDAARAVHAVADQRAVRIELCRMVEAPSHGDADLLGRVMLNLLDNAIKHSSEGGTVEVAMDRRDGRCEISVVDTGQGIPATAQPQVFERFFRADSTRSRSGSSVTSGAGLGLAIARRIAEMHAGRLELVESRPGRTEFRLTLPVDRVDQ